MERIAGLIVFVAVLAGCGSGSSGSVETVATTSSTPGDQPSSTPGDQPSPDTSPATSPVTAPATAPATPPPGWSVSPDPTLQPVPAPTPSTAPGAGTPLDHSSALVQGAIDDLAARLGIERADVAVVDARAVTWPDGSLGCPQPGMQYIQRLTDGALVILDAGGARYEYHGGNPLALCERPAPPVG
jgi:hypothetical protein